jgi:hypothetical protein
MASASSPPADTPNTAVRADDHGRWHVGAFKKPAPLRDHLTVTGEYDGLGRTRWDVDGDLPTTVVIERLGD